MNSDEQKSIQTNAAEQSLDSSLDAAELGLDSVRDAMSRACMPGASSDDRAKALRLSRRHARLVVKESYAKALGITVLHKAILAACAVALYLSVTMLTGRLMYLASMIAGLALAAFCLPMQVFVSSQLCVLCGAAQRLTRSRRYTWWRLSRLSLVRLLRGLAWGVPFAALCVFLYLMLTASYGMQLMNALKSLFDWMTPGGNLGLTPGLFVAIGLVPVTFALFLYGWNRGMVLQFQPVGSIGVKNSISRARRVRKAGKKLLRKNALLNALWLTPFAVAALALLYMEIQTALVSGQGIMGKLSNTLEMIEHGLSARFWAGILIAYIALDLLPSPYRKLANATLAHELGRAQHKARTRNMERRPHHDVQA